MRTAVNWGRAAAFEGGGGGACGTCQAVAMVGTAPRLMASTYCCARTASMGPVTLWLPRRLGSARAKMTLVSLSSPCGTHASRHERVLTAWQLPAQPLQASAVLLLAHEGGAFAACAMPPATM